MALAARQRLARASIPEADGPVEAAGSDACAVRAERVVENSFAREAQSCALPARCHVPKNDLVAILVGKDLAVRTEPEPGRRRTIGQLPDLLPRAEVPEPSRRIGGL